MIAKTYCNHIRGRVICKQNFQYQYYFLKNICFGVLRSVQLNQRNHQVVFYLCVLVCRQGGADSLLERSSLRVMFDGEYG